MKDRGQIRKEILKKPIGEIIDYYKECLEAASEHNADLPTLVSFSNDINNLEKVVWDLVDIDEDTDGLITEG